VNTGGLRLYLGPIKHAWLNIHCNHAPLIAELLGNGVCHTSRATTDIYNRYPRLKTEMLHDNGRPVSVGKGVIQLNQPA